MSKQDELFHQYYYFNGIAHQHCNGALYEQALAMYRRCLIIAQELQDDDKIAGSRSWIGECLRKLDRHEEALLILAPNLSKNAKGNAKELYNSMTTYIGIALELPADKDLIRDAIDETRAFLTRIGHLEWQHSLMLLESIYFEEQHILDEALNYSERAWSIWQQQYPYFTADSHFFQMTLTKIRLNHISDAKRIILEWENNSANTHPTTRVSQMSQAKSYIARRERRYQDSIAYAERAFDFARQLEVPRDLAATLMAQTYAYMLVGDFTQARYAISQMPSKILKQKKAYIIGDYHLSYARSLCGLDAIDIVYEDAFPELPMSIECSDNICRELARARLFYTIGLKRARQCDIAFACTWRQDKLQICLEHIAALESVLYIR